MKHITETGAEQYLQNKAGFLKGLQIKKHLKKCPECRGLIKQAEKDTELLIEIKDAVNEQYSDTSPQIKQDTLLKIRNKLEQ